MKGSKLDVLHHVYHARFTSKYALIASRAMIRVLLLSPCCNNLLHCEHQHVRYSCSSNQPAFLLQRRCGHHARPPPVLASVLEAPKAVARIAVQRAMRAKRNLIADVCDQTHSSRRQPHGLDARVSLHGGEVHSKVHRTACSQLLLATLDLIFPVAKQQLVNLVYKTQFGAVEPSNCSQQHIA